MSLKRVVNELRLKRTEVTEFRVKPGEAPGLGARSEKKKPSRSSNLLCYSRHLGRLSSRQSKASICHPNPENQELKLQSARGAGRPDVLTRALMQKAENIRSGVFSFRFRWLFSVLL